MLSGDFRFISQTVLQLVLQNIGLVQASCIRHVLGDNLSKIWMVGPIYVLRITKLRKWM